MDFMITDIEQVFTTSRYFNVLVYDPVKIFNNLFAAYEYCNIYLYIAQIALFLQLDYGFVSELTTRWSLLITEQSGKFFENMSALIIGTDERPVKYVDWYLVGF